MTRTEKMTELVRAAILEYGYICNSDSTDRIVDSFARTLAGEDELLFDELVEAAIKYLNNYNMVSRLDESANYTCYYSVERFSSIEHLELYYNIGE